jgi:hypothetical protein
MAKNDVVLLDAILEERKSAEFPSNDPGEVFEYFAFEQILKDYDLSPDELTVGWTDGRDDGGIDGLYIFVNGNPLIDPEAFVWPRSNASIEVWLLTCRRHATFQQAVVDTLLATVPELFDLSLDTRFLAGRYAEAVVNQRQLFHLAYRRLSITRAAVAINVVYASRGDTSSVGDSVARRAESIVGTFNNLFSSSSVKFRFIGAAELVEAHRRVKRFSLDLPFVEHLATGHDSYVLLVRLADYCRFVTDENGSLRRYLFDSNVRDYLGSNRVNLDIAASLVDANAPDFWWLNNGVTILATNATVPGKTIQLQDIQIVNGLQTTETIFRHFQHRPVTSSDRTVLVKIIVSTDPLVRDRIIRATNNQSSVEVAALHATDKIQRDIEAMLERHEWFYERRKNYFRNIGKPEGRIITPLYLASAVVAIVMKNAPLASNLRSRFMRNATSYEKVFSELFPADLWPALVGIYKQVDRALIGNSASRRMSSERFMRTWRGLIAFIAVARLSGTFLYNQDQIIGLDPNRLTQELVEDIWRAIVDSGKEGARLKRPTHELVLACYAECAERFHIEGPQYFRPLDFANDERQKPTHIDLTDELVNRVHELLPRQPWKMGAHREVAMQLEVLPEQVSAAIQRLISDGRRYEQRHGVVYGPNGEVVAFDPDRVSRTELLGTPEGRTPDESR